MSSHRLPHGRPDHSRLLARLYPKRDPRHLAGWIIAGRGSLAQMRPEEFIAEARIAMLCTGACPQLAEALACAYGL